MVRSILQRRNSGSWHSFTRSWTRWSLCHNRIHNNLYNCSEPSIKEGLYH